MCGIVGIASAQLVGEEGGIVKRLVDGLEHLEYRGYDSAGVALMGASGNEGHLFCRKAVGKIEALRESLKAGLPAWASTAWLGLGHTRWATHGAVTLANAHPQTDGTVAVVHNGIIENFALLKAQLLEALERDWEVAKEALLVRNEVQEKGRQTSRTLCEDLPLASASCPLGTKEEKEDARRSPVWEESRASSGPSPFEASGPKDETGEEAVDPTMISAPRQMEAKVWAALTSWALDVETRLLQGVSKTEALLPLTSQTDTEILVHLIARESRLGAPFPQAVARALAQAKGTFAVVILHRAYPYTMIAARRGSPLTLGRDGASFFVASDAAVLAPWSRETMDLGEGEMVVFQAAGKGELKGAPQSVHGDLKKNGSLNGVAVQSVAEKEDGSEVKTAQCEAADSSEALESASEDSSQMVRIQPSQEGFSEEVSAHSFIARFYALEEGMLREVPSRWVPAQVVNASADKGAYPDFTLKEMAEQPALLEGIVRRFQGGAFAELGRELAARKALNLIGCGSSFYASRVGQYWAEAFAHLATHAEIASEFRYRSPVVAPSSLSLFLSQSGETIDTLKALEYVQGQGGACAVLTNVAHSLMAKAVREVGGTARISSSLTSDKVEAHSSSLEAACPLAMGKGAPSIPGGLSFTGTLERDLALSSRSLQAPTLSLNEKERSPLTANKATSVSETEPSLAEDDRTLGRVLLLEAGPERSVVSTKAFTAQMAVLAAVVLEATDDPSLQAALAQDLARAPSLVREVLETAQKPGAEDPYVPLVERLLEAKTVLYLGRGVSYPIALEGALKLKETAYVPAEAYPAGELKHGPMALVDAQTVCVVLAPGDALFDKTLSNVQEVKARGGQILLLTDAQGARWLKEGAIEGLDGALTLVLPEAGPVAQAFTLTAACQMLAYKTAKRKGCNVDRPRNLAKAVTVE